MNQQPAADALRPKYRRVVLKLSGEGFGPSGKGGGISIDEQDVASLAAFLRSLNEDYD